MEQELLRDFDDEMKRVRDVYKCVTKLIRF